MKSRFCKKNDNVQIELLLLSYLLCILQLINDSMKLWVIFTNELQELVNVSCINQCWICRNKYKHFLIKWRKDFLLLFNSMPLTGVLALQPIKYTSCLMIQCETLVRKMQNRYDTSHWTFKLKSSLNQNKGTHVTLLVMKPFIINNSWYRAWNTTEKKLKKNK